MRTRPSASFGSHGAEFLDDVLVRQPVKPVADHALVAETPGQRVNLGEPGHVPMKRGVEASHLREVGKALTAAWIVWMAWGR